MLTYVIVLSAALAFPAEQPGTVSSAHLVQASPAPTATGPTQADIDRLAAEIFSLRARLVDTARRLAEEKTALGPCMARQAGDELEGLKREAATLSPAVRGLLGMPAQSDPPRAGVPASATATDGRPTVPPK
jgi:hypothetical protein